MLFHARPTKYEEGASFDSRYKGRAPPSPIPKKISEWKPVLEDMKTLMEAKDSRIRALEEENDYLHSQLRWLQRRLSEESKHPLPIEQENSPRGGRQQPLAASKGEGGLQVLAANPVKIFSPGTQIVADLASFMEIPVGAHAPLSFFIDKHWQRCPSG